MIGWWGQGEGEIFVAGVIVGDAGEENAVCGGEGEGGGVEL